MQLHFRGRGKMTTHLIYLRNRHGRKRWETRSENSRHPCRKRPQAPPPQKTWFNGVMSCAQFEQDCFKNIWNNPLWISGSQKKKSDSIKNQTGLKTSAAFGAIKPVKNMLSTGHQTCYQTSENRKGLIWSDFYVFWTLYPVFGVKDSIFGGQKNKILSLKKIGIIEVLW